MVQFCCVVGCGNRSNREQKQFHRLPNISKHCNKASYKAEIILRRRKQWLLNINRADLKDGDEAYSAGYIRVCSDHFVSGKPSAWSDVENIDWAPTLQMSCSEELKKSQGKRPQKHTALKRAMRVQELHSKLGLVADAKQSKTTATKGRKSKAAPKKVQGTTSGLISNAKQNKVTEPKGKKNLAKQKKVSGLLGGAKKKVVTKQTNKKNTAKGKTKLTPELKVKSPNSLRSSKQAPKKVTAPKTVKASKTVKVPKTVKAPKKVEPKQYTLEVQRMLKKQEIKVRRKILELELTADINGYPKRQKLTEHPIIHRITKDCIVSSVQEDAKTNKEGTSTDMKAVDSIRIPELKEEHFDSTLEVDTVTNKESSSTDLNTDALACEPEVKKEEDTKLIIPTSA